MNCIKYFVYHHNKTIDMIIQKYVFVLKQLCCYVDGLVNECLCYDGRKLNCEICVSNDLLILQR